MPLIAIVFALLMSPFVEAQAPALPAEIPLFPLPETSLFPGVSRPFLIFEPRYREMIADALKGNKIIGMVRLRPGFEKDYEGRPPIFVIGCAGEIEKYEELPDGRYVILLRGLTTFRVAQRGASASPIGWRVSRRSRTPAGRGAARPEHTAEPH